jgi:ribosomal protein S6
MELRFEHLTGKIEVKVYDMRGSLIDQFETFNDLENKTLQYDLKPSNSGIYFFVATGKEGSAARKVVVTQ